MDKSKFPTLEMLQFRQYRTAEICDINCSAAEMLLPHFGLSKIYCPSSPYKRWHPSYTLWGGDGIYVFMRKLASGCAFFSGAEDTVLNLLGHLFLARGVSGEPIAGGFVSMKIRAELLLPPPELIE